MDIWIVKVFGSVNNVTKITCVKVLYTCFYFIWEITDTELLSLTVNLFLLNWQIDLPSDHVYHFTLKNVWRFQFLYMSTFGIESFSSYDDGYDYRSHSSGCVMHLIVCFICISIKPKGAEHLFMYICYSYIGEMYKSFAHF